MVHSELVSKQKRALNMVGLELLGVNRYRVDFAKLKLEAPHCKELGCNVCLKRWGSYLRTAVLCADGTALEPIPIQRWRCPVHGTTSWLPGLRKVNEELVASVQARSPETTATLDMDATLAETSKKEAFFCYKGFPAYQPFNVFWAEHEMVLLSEFRDGNVNAGFEQKRILEESLDMLPPDVEKVLVRSDTAAYQVELLRYMAEGMSPRFGVIEFAVADVTQALKAEVARLKESDWKPLKKWDEKRKVWRESGQEWAEVVYVTDWIAHKKGNPDYRFLVSRERLSAQPLPGMEDQLDLPFPTQVFEKQGV